MNRLPRKCRRHGIVAIVLCLGLAGCMPAFESHEPVADTFVLVAPAGLEPVAALGGSLTVRLPTVRGGWDAEQLPVRLPDGRQSQLAAARWARSIDEGVAAVVMDTLRSRGGYSAVLADTSPFIGRWTLELAVDDFTAVYAQEKVPPRVRVLLSGALGRSRDGTLLGTVRGQGEATATADTRTAIAAAFNAALQAATLEVATQAEQLAAASAGR